MAIVVNPENVATGESADSHASQAHKNIPDNLLAYSTNRVVCRFSNADVPKPISHISACYLSIYAC